MSWGIIAGAAIGAVGSAVSSRKSGKAAESAAATEAGAQREAAEMIYKQFQETKESLMPYSELGLPAAQEQQALLGLSGAEAQEAAQARFQESPGYQFRLQRGLGAVDQGFGARGALVSGAREKARMEYGQGLASSEFSNYFNRLGSQAGLGLSATQAIGGVGSQAAQGQAQMTAGAGESLAQGAIGKAQSYQSGISDFSSSVGSMVEAWQNRKRD